MVEATLTMVMTDVQGSTRLWAEHPKEMLAAMTRHHELVHTAIADHGGWRPVDQGEGDAVFAAFESAPAAVEAVLDFQRRIAEEEWPAGIVLRDRVGVHIGEVVVQGGNLFGSPVNRTARIRSLGSGGQVLVSAAVLELVRDRLRPEAEVTDLGEHRMKDLDRPERLFQVVGPGMARDFPPLASLDLRRHNLPTQTSTFVGRDDELAAVVALVRRERLVTVLGFGGMGKTRLALHVAADLSGDDVFPDGVWFVDLATAEDPAEIASAIARALESSGGPDDRWDAVLAWLRERRLLLVLDNLEQLLPGIADPLVELMRTAPAVHVLATSRTAVRVGGEQVFALPALPVPEAHTGDWNGTDLQRLAAVPAVGLFVARATAARHDFALNAATADPIASICMLLDGLPLGLELAAARVRVMSVDALQARLRRDIAALSGAAADLPARQRTLRATIAWSVNGLEPGLAEVLARCSVFPGSFTLDAAEAIAGAPGVDAFDAIVELVDRSLLVALPDEDRFRLLVPIREYAASLLPADEIAALALRHFEYYRDLVVLPSGWSREQQDEVDEILSSDWHNVRKAIEFARGTGRDEEEVHLAASVCWWCDLSGLLGEAQDLLGRARRSAERVGPAEVASVLALQAEFATRSGEWDRSAELAAELLSRTAGLDDPSLVAIGLILGANFSESFARAAEMLLEARRALARLPWSGTAFPHWFVLEEWIRHALEVPDAREEVIAYWRNQLETGEDGSQLVRFRTNLALALRLAGRPGEAVELLDDFERDEAPDDAGTLLRMGAPFEAALCRIVLHQPAAARRDLDLALRASGAVDSPGLAAELSFFSSVVDRLLGEPAAAVERLERTVHAPSSQAEERGAAEWLLAVISREAGDVQRSAEHLDRAWADMPRHALARTEIAQCLREGATQNLESAPEHALQLMAAARRIPGQIELGWGVEYDEDGMLRRLRERLGNETVTAALEDRTAHPLPDSLRPPAQR